MYQRIDELEKKLQSKDTLLSNRIINPNTLAQGEEEIKIEFNVSWGHWKSKKYQIEKLNVSWDTIAYFLLPKLLQPVKESALKTFLSNSFKEIKQKYKLKENVSVTTSDNTFETIKIQLLALNLIQPITFNKDHTKTPGKFLKITSLGEEKLLELRAVKSSKVK